MNDILQVLFSPRFILSTSLFAFLSLVISWLGFWLENKLHESPFNQWLLEHIGIPLLHAIAMILFIVLLYPSFFPQPGIPDFFELLSNEAGRINQLINWVFILSLMIPMIPVLGPRLEIVLPIQGLVVLAIIGNWIGQFNDNPNLSLLPSGYGVLGMLFWGLVGASLAVAISRRLGERLDDYFQVIHSAGYLYPILALVLQTPTLVLYARELVPA